MTQTTERPVLFFAFANDRAAGPQAKSYLRNLPQEARSIRAALAQVEQAGLCQVEVRENVTVQETLAFFMDPRYHNRIAIFHYGGHAGSFGLLLEDATGNPATADADGLAAFLAQQRGLQLVFLNGCSTELQVEGLLQAGVHAVVATAQAIDDLVACEFAAHFYQSLGVGAGLDGAYETAAAAVRTAGRSSPRHLYHGGDNPATPSLDRWPWLMRLRPGSELAAQWNLPAEANAPLFGLPALPQRDLPASPYRDLHWYTQAEAELFFGRGREIRSLYRRVTEPSGAPIILFYGQSGVGKSSLLDAGLTPRLAADYSVCYLRREQTLGLLGTLANGLSRLAQEQNPPVSDNDDLLALWCSLETPGRPLVVILDQMEEVFTRADPKKPQELDAFLAGLQTLFGHETRRPRGKLVLSFRKEWLAELARRMAEYRFFTANLFLERLDRDGIMEVVNGPADTPRLQQHYGLTVAQGLAERIADDLLSDPDSPVATTLQILLTRLWAQAKARDGSRPTFDADLYGQLKRRGIALENFLDQQIAALGQAMPAAAESGLALDVLAFHTTPLGTAGQRKQSELHTEYGGRPGLPDLVQQAKDLYLLSDMAAETNETRERVTRLAHDTLAPLVRHRFDESDLPGPRARRILESRREDWRDGKEGAPLDETDLALVEAGKEGMRNWKPDEERLMAASYAAQAERREQECIRQAELEKARTAEQAERERRAAADARALEEETNAGRLRRRALWLAGAVVVAVLLAALAGYLATVANEARGVAEVARDEVERLGRAIRADQLTARANTWVDSDPQLALAMAVEGLRTQLDRQEPVDTAAVANVYSLLGRVGGRPLAVDEPIYRFAYSPDGRFLALGMEQSLVLVDITTNPGDTRVITDTLKSTLSGLQFGADGEWLAAGTYDGSVWLWSLHQDRPLLHPVCNHRFGPVLVEFAEATRSLITLGGDGKLCLTDISQESSSTIVEIDGEPVFDWSPQLAVAKDTRFFLTAGGSEELLFWHDSRNSITLPQSEVGFSSHFDSFAISDSGQWAALNFNAGGIVLWHLQDIDSLEPQLLFVEDSACDFIEGIRSYSSQVGEWELQTIAFSPDGKYVAAASDLDYGIGVWNLTAPERAPLLLCGHTADIWHLVFSAEGLLASAGRDGIIRLWDLDLQAPIHLLRGHGLEIRQVKFNPDGSHLTSLDVEGMIKIWNVHSPAIEPLTFRMRGQKAIAFPSSGEWMVSIGIDDTSLRFQRTRAPMSEPYAPSQARGSVPMRLASAMNSPRIAVAFSDGSTRLWEVGSEIREVSAIIAPDHGAPSRPIALSPNGELLARVEREHVVLYAVSNPAGVTVTLPVTSVEALAFSHTGQELAVLTNAQTEIVPLGNSSALPMTLESGTDVWLQAAAFSPNGLWFAHGGRGIGSSVLRIYATDRLDTPWREIDMPGQTLNALAFSPDGMMLATATLEGFIHLLRLDAPDADPLLIRAHGGQVLGVTFTPDGRQIASVGSDGKIHLWRLGVEKLLDIACAHLTRPPTRDDWERHVQSDIFRNPCSLE